MCSSSQGDSKGSIGKIIDHKIQNTKIEMLSNLLQKEGEKIGIKSISKAETNDPLKLNSEQRGFEIAKNHDMNMFKFSSATHSNISNLKVENESSDNSGPSKVEINRHINFDKNEYLSKLFNDIKKSQNQKAEKQLNIKKEEVFNDTFGNCRTHRDPKIDDKENKIPKIADKEKSAFSEKCNVIEKYQKTNSNVFKKITNRKSKDYSNQTISPISQKNIRKQSKKKPQISKIDVENKRIFKQLNSSGRNISLTEKRSKRSVSKKSLKKKKFTTINNGDNRRNKINR